MVKAWNDLMGEEEQKEEEEEERRRGRRGRRRQRKRRRNSSICQLLGDQAIPPVPLGQGIKTPPAVVSKAEGPPAAVTLVEVATCWLALSSWSCTRASSVAPQQDHGSLSCSSIRTVTQLHSADLLWSLTVDWPPRLLPSPAFRVIASATI